MHPLISSVPTTIGSSLRNDPTQYSPRIINSEKAVPIESFFPREKLPVITAELLQQQLISRMVNRISGMKLTERMSHDKTMMSCIKKVIQP